MSNHTGRFYCNFYDYYYGGSNVVHADLELYIAKDDLGLLISLHSPQVHYYYFKIVFFSCIY